MMANGDVCLITTSQYQGAVVRSEEESQLIQEAGSLFSAEGSPLQRLLNTGTLSPGWTERYLAFVERVRNAFGPSDPLPREVVAAIYTASVYCTKRYEDWHRLTGKANGETRSQIDQIRWAGDGLIMQGLTGQTEPRSIPPHASQDT